VAIGPSSFGGARSPNLESGSKQESESRRFKTPRRARGPVEESTAREEKRISGSGSRKKPEKITRLPIKKWPLGQIEEENGARKSRIPIRTSGLRVRGQSCLGGQKKSGFSRRGEKNGRKRRSRGSTSYRCKERSKKVAGGTVPIL